MKKLINRIMWYIYVKAYNGTIPFPNKLYLKLQYRLFTAKKLKIRNPKGFNEKLQWMKLYYHDPLMKQLADKSAARKYVSSKGLNNILVPCFGIYKKWDAINFDSLPDQFVIKCTHDSGSVCICTDKSSFDFGSAREKIEKSLKIDYFYRGREWAYKDIKPQIIIEKYLYDSSAHGLNDYKFFCFYGKPMFMFVATERFSQDGAKFNYYDMDYNMLPFEWIHRRSNDPQTKPKNFEKMKEYAAILSEGFPHVRIDFYEENDQTFFSEFTFYSGGGRHNFHPEEYNEIIGSMFRLPPKRK